MEAKASKVIEHLVSPCSLFEYRLAQVSISCRRNVAQSQFRTLSLMLILSGFFLQMSDECQQDYIVCTGTTPNLFWTSITMEELREHELFTGLPADPPLLQPSMYRCVSGTHAFTAWFHSFTPPHLSDP